MERRAESKPRTIEVSTSWKVLELLDRLVATGLYGPTREAAAEEVLRDGLRRRFPPLVPPEESR